MHIIPQTTRRQPRLLFLCVFLLGAHVASGIAQAGRESDSNEDIFVGPNNDDDHQHDPLDLGDGARYNYCEADHPIAGRHPSPRVANSKLVNVQLFTRHGDRTSTIFHPNEADLTFDCSDISSFTFTGTKNDPMDPTPFARYANVVAQQVVTSPPDSPFAKGHWKNSSCEIGQLTAKGAAQHRALGKALREIYVDQWNFLPKDFDQEHFYIRSTDVWRTKQSAENLMIGFYGSDARSRNLPPPTFQTHTFPPSIEYLTMNTDQCPRIPELLNQYSTRVTNKVLGKIYRDNMNFLKTMKDRVGFEGDFGDYISEIMPRFCHGYPLQCREKTTRSDSGTSKECVTKELIDRLFTVDSSITVETLRDGRGVHKILQLGMGSVANDIRKNAQEAADGAGGNGGGGDSRGPRFRLYSGHDSTIQPLLGLFDSLDVTWPPYASNLLIELWKTPSSVTLSTPSSLSDSQGQGHFVRVIYNSRVLQTKSRWCDLSWCPLDKFVAYLDRFIVKDLTSECKAKKPMAEVFVEYNHI